MEFSSIHWLTQAFGGVLKYSLVDNKLLVEFSSIHWWTQAFSGVFKYSLVDNKLLVEFSSIHWLTETLRGFSCSSPWSMVCCGAAVFFEQERKEKGAAPITSVLQRSQNSYL